MIYRTRHGRRVRRTQPAGSAMTILVEVRAFTTLLLVRNGLAGSPFVALLPELVDAELCAEPGVIALVRVVL